MGNNFLSKWKEKDKQPSVVEKIKNVAKQPEPLKDQISMVIQRLDTQTRTLDAAVQRFEIRDRDIFARVVKALSDRDEARANILATELSEIRKVKQMLTHASLGLQSVSMRLSTVSEMGDIVTVLAPAKNVISSIGSEMCGILPEASQELGNIGSLLSDICSTTNNSGSEVPLDVGRASPEAEKILEEAEIMAESRLKEQLPEVSPSRTVRERASMEA